MTPVRVLWRRWRERPAPTAGPKGGGRRKAPAEAARSAALDRHRADRATVVRAALEEAGIEVDDLDEFSTDATDDPRYLWIPVNSAEIDAATYVHVMVTAITQRQRWREQYATAQARAGPVVGYSATGVRSATENSRNGGADR